LAAFDPYRARHLIPGPRTFRTLINQFGGAARAITRLPDLAQRGGGKLNVPSREEAEKEIAAAAKLGLTFIGLGEAEYPARLRETGDAPPLLAVRGNIAALADAAVAMVGSRNASAAGARFAGHLARDLGQARFVIVSGLARGIDGASHYPPEHAKLLDEIVEKGAAVSEMPLSW
jgi:DNA processing protein